MKTSMLILTATCVCFLSPASRADTPGKPTITKPDSDFFALLELGEATVQPVKPNKDAKTGFVVGGQNETEAHPETHGKSIAELEKVMRPGAEGREGSVAGFLGDKEQLLDVLAADNDIVTVEWGLSHQEVAKYLHAMGAIAAWQWKYKQEGKEFVYHGRRFKVEAIYWRGYQYSPFQDGTKTNCDIKLENLENGKTLSYSMLVPDMIARYGFYEGKGTKYRVDPRDVFAVFDFLHQPVALPQVNTESVVAKFFTREWKRDAEITRGFDASVCRAELAVMTHFESRRLLRRLQFHLKPRLGRSPHSIGRGRRNTDGRGRFVGREVREVSEFDQFGMIRANQSQSSQSFVHGEEVVVVFPHFQRLVSRVTLRRAR